MVINKEKKHNYCLDTNIKLRSYDVEICPEAERIF